MLSKFWKVALFDLEWKSLPNPDAFFFNTMFYMYQEYGFTLFNLTSTASKMLICSSQQLKYSLFSKSVVLAPGFHDNQKTAKFCIASASLYVSAVHRIIGVAHFLSQRWFRYLTRAVIFREYLCKYESPNAFQLFRVRFPTTVDSLRGDVKHVCTLESTNLTNHAESWWPWTFTAINNEKQGKMSDATRALRFLGFVRPGFEAL